MHTMKTWKKITCALLLGGLTATSHAQSMQDVLSQLTGEAAKQYIAPIVSGFGSDLNSGWYHKAPSADKFRFSFEAGTIAMGTFLSGGNSTFNVGGTFRFDSTQSTTLVNNVDVSGIPAQYQQSVKDSIKSQLASHDNPVLFFGPTIVGSTSDTVHVALPTTKFATHAPTGSGVPDSLTVPGDTLVLAGGGVAVNGLLHDFLSIPLPMVAPQISFGTVFGTNLTIRYFPKVQLSSEIGSFNFFGFGIQHNPQVWLGSKLPIDLCLGYFHQDMTVGSLFEATTNAYGLDVSKQLGWRLLNITPYAGYQYETADMTFHYTTPYTDPITGESKPLNVNFDVQGENHNRFTAGLSIHILILNVNADYNFAKYNSVSAGLMLGI